MRLEPSCGRSQRFHLTTQAKLNQPKFVEKDRSPSQPEGKREVAGTLPAHSIYSLTAQHSYSILEHKHINLRDLNLGGEDHNDSAQPPRLNSIDYNVLLIKYIPDSNFWVVTFPVHFCFGSAYPFPCIARFSLNSKMQTSIFISTKKVNYH